MDMILWVEDDESVIKQRMAVPAGLDDKIGIKNYFQKQYHISIAYGMDEALSLVRAHDYDYVILDVNLPVNASDNFGKVVKSSNWDTIEGFMQSDDEWSSIDESGGPDAVMKYRDFYNKNTRPFAGVYLYTHFIHQVNIRPEQIRIYSGHLDQLRGFESRIEKQKLPKPDQAHIFGKAAGDDEEVSKFIREVIESPERILRHAMIEGCDVAMKTDLRRIYPRYGGEAIEPGVLWQHISTIRDVVKALGPKFESDPVKKGFYLSLLILLITSECQEQDSYHKENTYEFKQLMGVLDRIRNMDTHAQKNLDYSCLFVAFTFLVYIRAKCDFDKLTMEFEKNLLALFGDAYFDKIKSNLVDSTQELCGKTGIPKDIKNGSYKYQALLGKKFVENSKHQYGEVECFRLFLHNFVSMRRAQCDPPRAVIVNQEGKSFWGEVQGFKNNEEIKFSDNWYEDYFRYFYQKAFPKK